MIVTEREIDEFRRVHLAPEAILAAVERDVRVLYRLPVGVGKSNAVDRLLQFPQLYQRFDLVIYGAPSWDVIRERAIVAGKEVCLVPWTILEPRPAERCGKYAGDWSDLERRGCAAFAKTSLCTECRARDPAPVKCSWPERMKRLSGKQLVFTTEQQMVLNRSLVSILKGRTGHGRSLVILDEARQLDANFEMTLDREDLERFRDLLRDLGRGEGLPGRTARAASEQIDALMEASSEDLAKCEFRFPSRLNRLAGRIQADGVRRFGSTFRYVGYDLSAFASSRTGERWKDRADGVRFAARPHLDGHVLLLSAHLTAEYAGHRLGAGGPVTSPFENVRFHHSGTGIFNLRNRSGADRHFGRRRPEILDTIALLILRNVCEGRSTLLVSRKKHRTLCAEYLAARLAKWQEPIRFVTEGIGDLPVPPDVRVIPIIHYGILGVNSFSEYESAYCLNSYYVGSYELNRLVQDAEPAHFRVQLAVEAGADRTRRVRIADRGVPDLDRTMLGDLYLRKLEVDPIIQAVGRVRFQTRPREVLFFAMHDLQGDVGECIDVPTLSALREALGLPAPKEVDRELTGRQARELMREGETAEEAARRLGISRRTLFRRLQGGAESAKKGLHILYKPILALSPLATRAQTGDR